MYTTGWVWCAAAVTSLMEIKDKVETPLGRVIWMMAVMGAALKKGDKVMALDCYFSLLYVEPSLACTWRGRG